MMIPRNVLLALVIGAVIGGVSVRVAEAVPALAQTGSPTPAASQASAQPMPMASLMMGPQMMHMMPAPKSNADRAYMGAMMQMHGGMMRVTMTGNPDHDFLVMMIPHHQAAVAMAQTELQYGHDSRARALAARIISAQQAEIRKMQT